MLPMTGHPVGPGGRSSLEDGFLNLEQTERSSKKERVKQVSEPSHSIIELV